MVETVLKEVDGRIPVIVGTAGRRRKRRLNILNMRKRTGADCACTLLTRYYCKAKRRGDFIFTLKKSQTL
ncbi:dihydrodipicolinate synthase family protein [Bacillus cereus]